MSDTPDKSKTTSPPTPTPAISPVHEPDPAQPQAAQPESVPAFPSSGGDHGNFRSQFPPTIPEVPTKGPAYPVPARPRINSVVNPVTSSASPLALLFQPLVVDDDVITEDQEDNQNPPKAPNILSYGPASRRRLVSLGPRRRSRALTETSPVASTLNRWQRPDSRQPSHSLTRSDDGDQISMGPDPGQINPSTSSVHETAGQVLEDEERDGGEPGLSRRLEMMEERQRRIEAMLVKLTENLS